MKPLKTTAALAALALLALTGCDTAAKKANENMTTAADNFEVQRKIIGTNTRTMEYLFEVEGRCSVERENGWLVALCKHSDTDFRRHYVSQSTDTSIVITQQAPIALSEFHTRVVIRPESLLPNLELITK